MSGEKSIIGNFSQLAGVAHLALLLTNTCSLKQVFPQQLAEIGSFLLKQTHQRLEQFCSRIELHCRFSLVIRTAKVAEAGGVASVLGGGQQA
mgnify:CR=1 FL=1